MVVAALPPRGLKILDKGVEAAQCRALDVLVKLEHGHLMVNFARADLTAGRTDIERDGSVYTTSAVLALGGCHILGQHGRAALAGAAPRLGAGFAGFITAPATGKEPALHRAGPALR
jgi:hypothetical protein